jgi:antitoxin VapB
MFYAKPKLFTNGRSQAVRLAAAFRSKGSEVYVRKDPDSGEVILSEKRPGWSEFFAARDLSDPETASFLSDREDPPPQERELF